MFNFVILLSLHLVSVLFDTSIPTPFYIFLKCFFIRVDSLAIDTVYNIYGLALVAMSC